MTSLGPIPIAPCDFIVYKDNTFDAWLALNARTGSLLLPTFRDPGAAINAVDAILAASNGGSIYLFGPAPCLTPIVLHLNVTLFARAFDRDGSPRSPGTIYAVPGFPSASPLVQLADIHARLESINLDGQFIATHGVLVTADECSWDWVTFHNGTQYALEVQAANRLDVSNWIAQGGNLAAARWGGVDGNCENFRVLKGAGTGTTVFSGQGGGNLMTNGHITGGSGITTANTDWTNGSFQVFTNCYFDTCDGAAPRLVRTQGGVTFGPGCHFKNLNWNADGVADAIEVTSGIIRVSSVITEADPAHRFLSGINGNGGKGDTVVGNNWNNVSAAIPYRNTLPTNSKGNNLNGVLFD